MIQITKEESMALRTKYPDVSIAITSRQTSHKKYYAESSRRVQMFIERFRSKGKRQKFVKE